MALKDWKKYSTEMDGMYTINKWKTKNKEYGLIIEEYPVYMGDGKFRFEVISISYNKNGTKDGNTLKNFSLKSQALKFAKSYMRRH